MLKLKEDGYVYISDRGIEYELLEGVGIGGRKCTSDIIFICLMNSEYNVDDMIVGYLYGAMLFEDDLSGYEKSIKELVEEYEKRNFGLNKIIAALNEKMEIGYDKAQLEVDYGELDECEGYYISKLNGWNGWGATPITPILATENDVDDDELIAELDKMGIAYCI